MKRFLILLLACLFMTTSFTPFAFAENTVEWKEWYVSPTGNDNGTGSQDDPFQTLAKAVSVMDPGDVCYLREGIYHEILKPKSYTTIKAYPGEKPVISACDELTNWTSLGNQLYSAPMDWTLADQNMILVDGEFAYEARWPDNVGSLLYPTMSTVTKIDTVDRTKFSDTSLPQDIDPVGASAWICGGSRWIFWNRKVSAYDADTNTITLASPYTTTANKAYDPTVGNPYVLMGKREFLSCQNEWYYDATEKKIILWSAKTPSSMLIEAKKRTETLDLSGVTNVTIDGIALTGGRIISSANTSYCSLRNINSTYAAHSFTRNVHGHQIKGHHNSIENSEFAYASFTIIQETGNDNRYVNNLIRDMNYNANFVGSVNLAGNRTLFSHNTVHSGGRELLTLHNGKAGLVQYNDMYHSSTITWDTAAMYVNMTDGNNTVIRYNTVHDTISTRLGMGIYFDPCSQNFIVYGNVIWNMTDSAIRLNNPANYILVYQNSAYNTGPMSTVCSGDRINGDLYGTRFINNIFDGSTMKNYPDNTVFQYNILKEYTLVPAKWDYQMETEPFLGTVKGSVNFQDPERGDLRLVPGSAALTSGISVPGVSNQNYIGAYPPNAQLLNTGRNLSWKFNDTYEFPNVIHMNRIRNAGFGYGDFRYWEKEGTQVSIMKDSSWSNANAKTRAGSNSVCLGTGTNAATQTITGLSKNTTYTLSGWARVGAGSVVTMGVRELGQAAEFTEDKWTPKYVTFNTGDRTEVTVYYQSTGSGVSYCGDIGMSQPTLMSAEEAKKTGQETVAEDYEAIDLSDTVHYRRLTVTGITFSENTAQVALLNNTGTALTAECQLITYRIRNNKKEYLSMERVPVNVASGTTSSPYQANIPVSFTRQTEPGRYQVLVRMMKHDLFTPLGQSATFSYEIK